MLNLFRMIIEQLAFFLLRDMSGRRQIRRANRANCRGGSHNRGHVERNQFKLWHDNPVEFLMKFRKFARSLSDFVYRQLESERETRY